MMCKRCAMILIFLVLFVNPFNETINAQEEYILLVYDRYKKFGEDFNLLNNVLLPLLTLNENIHVRKIESLKKAEVESAKEVKFLISDEENYKDFESYLDINSNSTIIKEEVIYNNWEGYVVIRDVYPYSNLEDVKKKAIYLKEKGIPYIVEAKPVFNNLEYDAMERYTTTLRYLAYNGGSIFLSFPEVINSETPKDEVLEYIDKCVNTFIDEEVYPIGMVCSNKQFYNEEFRELISKCNTLVLQNTNNINMSNFNGDINNIENVLVEGVNCVFINVNFEMEDFEHIVQGFLEEKYSVKDIRHNNEIRFKFSGYEIITNKLGLFCNNNKVINNLSKSENSIIEEEKSKVINLKMFNMFIYVITSIGIVIFIIFYLNSRKIDKKKYFKGGE